MSKLFIISIQGQELVTVNGEQERHGQYSNFSQTKVLDLSTSKKLDWKLGCFLQPKGQMHSDEELEKLENLGFNITYIHPWDNTSNNKDAMNYVKKVTNIYDEYEDENEDIISGVFDGYVIIGEIEKEKAEKLSKEYRQENYVY